MSTQDSNSDDAKEFNQRVITAIQAYGYAVYDLIAREGVFDWQTRHAWLTGNGLLGGDFGPDLRVALKSREGSLVFAFMRDMMMAAGLPEFYTRENEKSGELMLDCHQEVDVMHWVRSYCDSVLSGHANSEYIKSTVECDCEACKSVDLLADTHPDMMASPLTPSVVQAMLMLCETASEEGKIELTDWIEGESDDANPMTGITNMIEFLAQNMDEQDFDPIPKLDRASMEDLCDQLFDVPKEEE